ncbi:alpha/beta hydrolase [Kitasatospora sp. MAP5-34]|uniref:alpha/beta fold hydrolase n=1 Tax=Kitasatospora sp. MAP5-34 TaxID=3035102 RepID=UPI002472EA08|nr:alpha/beta hydrolase [Kitasatospora sp. MAP5-34]MDH6578765.1 pimeloyl-ACP methyl ester carboxylesterase [Kitasatospora sp. MAP5-34]
MTSTASSARTQFLTLPGGRIAFDDTATGTGTGTNAADAAGATDIAVVLLPGMLDSRTTYRHLHPLLVAAGHRVITMDLRGFGESSIAWDDYSPAAIADDVLALLDHLNVERAVLVGSSYTAATVVKAAGLAPERVAGIALLDGFVENLPQNAFQRGIGKVLGAAVLWFPAVWGWYLKYMAYPTAKPADFEEYRSGLVDALRTPGRRIATRGYVTGDSAPVGWCAAVRSPALVVMGSKDPDFPSPAVVADRQAQALNARKVMIEGAGHYPMAEFPQATADALLPFLAEITGIGENTEATRAAEKTRKTQNTENTENTRTN